VNEDVKRGNQLGTPGARPKQVKFGPASDVPLVLGGHSFISQLGNDPPASHQDQCAIVESCLDCGIRWIDTTYQPERIALGNVLHELGRRHEATILAWSFFSEFLPGERVGEPEYYRPGHIDVVLEELRTDYVDCLVVMPLDDADENRRQEELAVEWRRKGYVRSLGLWVTDAKSIDRYRDDNPFRFAIRPFNITTEDAAPVLAACKKIGFETLATSPFFRGWELERMIVEASARGYGDPNALSPVLADLMLRFSLFQPDVDRVIVGMRKVALITRNLESVSRGPLTAEENAWLRRLRAPAEKRRWWRRLGAPRRWLRRLRRQS
jgi:aryl-alcohol dehydrogenase-like predicted oxidoreductase